MAQTAILRPGTSVYSVSPREYILDWGVSPQLSVMLRDDTPDLGVRSFFLELRSEGKVDLDRWRRNLGSAAFDRLVQPLLDRDLLVPAALVMSVRDGLLARSPMTVGVAGCGAPLYTAIETLARHKPLVRRIRVWTDHDEIGAELRALFPYCHDDITTVGDFARMMDVGFDVAPTRDADHLAPCDVIIVAVPRFDLSLMLAVEKIAAARGVAWAHSLSSCAFGLAGPIVGTGTGICAVDLIENLKQSGFFQESQPDPMIEPTASDEWRGTSVSVLGQIVPKTTIEALRFAACGSSALRATIHMVDADRGLVARSRILAGAAQAPSTPASADPGVAPPLVERVRALSTEADTDS